MTLRSGEEPSFPPHHQHDKDHFLNSQMAFTGTLDKCTACDKTVYVVDLLSADGNPYHKSCFKCTHCKGTLVMSNYSSMDGVLYCKTHFEQLFKESGNFSKNFQTEKKPEKQQNENRVSALFSGTQDKCAACQKTVYPLEKVTMEGEGYHKQCFKCAHGGCPLTHSSYAALNGVLYCKHHFQQLFMVKGDYNHVLNAVTKKNASDQPPEGQSNAEEDAKTDEPGAGAEAETESKEEEVKGDGDSEQPNEQS